MPITRIDARSAIIARPFRPAALALAAALLPAVGAGSVAAGGAETAGTDPTPAASALETMRQGRLGPERSLPEGGVRWQVGDARFLLDSGTVRWMEPAMGLVTGLVFEGEGRFQLSVAHEAELRQLRRFAEDPDIEGVSSDFSRMTLRGAGLETLLGTEVVDPAGPHEESPDLRGTTETWARWGGDPDARVLAALLNPADLFVRAEMDTEDHGTVTFEYDEGAMEEMTVSRIHDGTNEIWVSLDRPDERREDGSPGSEWTDEWLSLVRFDGAVDVTEPGRGAARGVGDVNPVHAVYSASATYRAKRDGVQVARLGLSPRAEVTAVADAGGAPLDFVRFHLGGLSRSLPDDFYDPTLTVLLAAPLAAGEEVELRFDYEMEMGNFASLLSWYPTPEGMSFEELHHVRLAITHRRDYEVRATGRLVEQTEEGRQVTSVWETDQPVDAAAFTIARLPYEKTFTYDGLPPIHMFGTQAGSMSADKIESFAPDVINAVNYFQNLFGTDVDADDLYITYIASGHGQAGQGFIHISDGIAQFSGRANRGTREAFLAHEVAHEWWGHQLSWASYRDQWLSEGLAEYSSMMFVEASLDKGPKILEDMVRAYHDEVNGSLRSAFGAFARPGLALLNKAGRDRVGPIGHGYRAATSENPAAYQSMAYTKGSLVMHSLRTILRSRTGNDELFVTILRDFVEEHRGGAVRTEDLIATIQRHARSDFWPVFFDQYVYSNAIPTLDWDHQTRRDGDQWILVVEVEQSGVPEDFQTAVPLRVTFGGDRGGEMMLMVDEPSKRFEMRLPEEPDEVVLNPGLGVLAVIE